MTGRPDHDQTGNGKTWERDDVGGRRGGWQVDKVEGLDSVWLGTEGGNHGDT